MFLRPDVAEKIGRLYKSGLSLSIKQREDFNAALAARPRYSATVEGARAASSSDPENYAVVGTVAQIRVAGVLSETPDFWAWLMGEDQTCYQDIRDSFALAGADPNVQSVILDVHSPGGYCDGMFDTLSAIEAFGKPIAVQASLACSAAYALAAMAGPITPLGPASEFGSIGVVQTYSFWADQEIINVTSTPAPNKRPDPRTPDGKAVIVAELDACHELFADAIARGRTNATGMQFTVERVNSDFGRGATMLAAAAFEAGLIDKKPKKPKRGTKASGDDEVEVDPTPASRVAAANNGAPAPQQPPSVSAAAEPPPSPPREPGHESRKTKMNEKELLAQHPELHAAVLAQGVTQERDRVCAHLTMGEASGDMPTAIAAINAGTAMTATLQAKYMAAGMNRASRGARQDDSDAAGAVVAGASPAAAAAATPEASSEDKGDKVADEIDRQLGRTSKKVA